MARRHHYVSNAYLKAFASSSSGKSRIVLASKNDISDCKIVGTRNVCVEKGFNSYFDASGTEHEDLEVAWSHVEQRIFPILRNELLGDTPEIPSIERIRKAIRLPVVEDAVLQLVAMHFVRNRVLRDIADEVEEKVSLEHSKQAGQRGDLRDAFMAEYGRAPRLGEIEGMMRSAASDLRRSRVVQVEMMEEGFAVKVPAILRDRPLQVVVSRSPIGFLTSCNPVVIADGDRIGLQEGVAIGDADALYMPFSHRIAFTYNDHPVFRVRIAAVDEIRRLNAVSVRNAKTYVLIHPNDLKFKNRPV